MGSFDTVAIYCKLPDGFTPKAEFQTSDLDEQFEGYEINEDNILVKLKSNCVCPNKPYKALHPFTGQLNLFYCGDVEDDGCIEYAFYLKKGIVLRKVGNLFEGTKSKTCCFIESEHSGEIQVQIS